MSEPFANGIRQCQVTSPEIGFKHKFSTLFPDDWNVQKILTAIERARTNGVVVKIAKNRTIKEGSFDGVKIRLITEDNQIISAFPIID